jgi:AcrR family transcriptional regulator
VFDRVLDTTLEILSERGYAFSVDEVAVAAGVHKTTIYRRFPTKSSLVAAAVERLATIQVPVVRTDDPVADLAALAVTVARALRTPSGAGALRAVVAAAGDDPTLVPTARQFLTGRYQLAVDVIDDAVAAGHFRAGIDPVLVWEAIVNPLHIRTLLGKPAKDAEARALVSLVLDGVRA